MDTVHWCKWVSSQKGPLHWNVFSKIRRSLVVFITLCVLLGSTPSEPSKDATHHILRVSDSADFFGSRAFDGNWVIKEMLAQTFLKKRNQSMVTLTDTPVSLATLQKYIPLWHLALGDSWQRICWAWHPWHIWCTRSGANGWVHQWWQFSCGRKK